MRLLNRKEYFAIMDIVRKTATDKEIMEFADKLKDEILRKYYLMGARAQRKADIEFLVNHTYGTSPGYIKVEQERMSKRLSAQPIIEWEKRK